MQVIYECALICLAIADDHIPLQHFRQRQAQVANLPRHQLPQRSQI